MSLPELPKPDETRPASALAAHQVMSAHIEKLTNCEPMDAHCSCGGSWVERESFKRLQITDLPQIKPTVTEYRERCLSCERCGHETYASARLPLGESRFGPSLHTFVVSLNLESRLSFRQIRALLKQSFNLSVSVGAISDMVKRVARHSKSSFEELLTWYRQDKGAKHVDETGWKVRGERTRPLVIKRKLSFGNDTPQSADRFAQLMSIIEIAEASRSRCLLMVHQGIPGGDVLVGPHPTRLSLTRIDS